MKFISVDDHLVEGERLWLDRLPRAYRDTAPQWTKRDDGRAVLLVEGRSYPPQTRTIQFVKGNEERIARGEFIVSDRYRHALMPSESLDIHHDPAARAKLLRESNILGSVNFPTVPRFAGTIFLEFEDKQLADLCVKAWNDWMFDEWCAGDPDLYIPMSLVQLWDPIAAAAEIRRNAERGGRAVSLSENPAMLGLPSYYTRDWDPLWEAIAETGTVVCMHLGSQGSVPMPPDAPKCVSTILSEQNCMSALINLLFSPVPERFGDIKFVLSESGIAWVPGLLERADREWEEYRHWDDITGLRPSETYRRSFYCCTVGERSALLLRDMIGVNTMLWECDFPHAESPWPNVEASLRAVSEGIPDADLDAVTHGNASELFRWKV